MRRARIKLSALAAVALLLTLGWVQAYAPGQSGVGGGNGPFSTDRLYGLKARYYDAEAKRFLSADPIGLAGGYNLYVYGNANPLYYIDPSGEWAGIDDLIALGGGALVGLAGQGVADLFAGKASGWEDYTSAAIGGAVMGETLLYGGPVAAGAAGGMASSTSRQWLKMATGKQENFSYSEAAIDTGLGAVFGKIPVPGTKVAGVTVGRGSYKAVANQAITGLEKGQIQNISAKTGAKIVTATFVEHGVLQGTAVEGAFEGIFGPVVDQFNQEFFGGGTASSQPPK